MTRGLFLQILILILAVLAGAASAFAQPFVQTTTAVTFQDTQDTFLAPMPIGGSTATLTRYQDAVAVRINTNSLPPGAYTVWWLIFNNSTECNGPCDADDFFRPEVQMSVFWATGGIVGPDGTANFRAFVRELEMPQLPGKVVFPGAGGLLHSRMAEVQLAIEYHGEVRGDIVGKQIGTIYGACMDTPGPVTHPVDPVESDRTFPCFAPQGVIFPAPNPADIPMTCPTDPDLILEQLTSSKDLLNRLAIWLGLRP